METLFDEISEKQQSFTREQFLKFLLKAFPGAADDNQLDHKGTIIFDHYATSGEMSKQNFGSMWSDLLESCLKPKTALIVVDFQNDFIDGSMALNKYPLRHEPLTLVPQINKLIDRFDEVVYTYDWHPEDHISFIDNRNLRKLHSSNCIDTNEVRVIEELVFDINGRAVVQQMWPRHCVQQSKGAQLHKELKIKQNAIFIYKGTNPDIDSYSAFYDNARLSQTELKNRLRERNVTNLIVVGLAFDACVSYTALDAVREGFTTCILEDATAGICESSSILAATRCKQNSLPLLTCNDIDTNLVEGPLPWTFVWQKLRQILIRARSNASTTKHLS